MNDWISTLFKIDKLPFKIVLLFSLISGITLFAPTPILEQLQIAKLKQQHGEYIGIFFLISVGLTATNFIVYMTNFLLSKYRRHKINKLTLGHLRTLDRAEKAILREFYIQGKNVIILPINTPSTIELLNKRIIELASKQGERIVAGDIFPCRISNFAKKSITYESIDMPLNTDDPEEIARLREERPAFLRELEMRDRLKDFY